MVREERWVRGGLVRLGGEAGGKITSDGGSSCGVVGTWVGRGSGGVG